MSFTYKEFNIKSREETFRVGKITPIEMLSISGQVDFENYTMTKELTKFCLEHTEVKIADKWLAVKTLDEEVYWPMGIEEDYIALNEIFTYITTEVIIKAFMKSSK